MISIRTCHYDSDNYLITVGIMNKKTFQPIKAVIYSKTESILNNVEILDAIHGLHRFQNR